MASVTDDRGYNQGFKPTRALGIRTGRRASLLLSALGAGRFSESQSILEIGCGSGELAYRIAQHTRAQVLATDLCLPFVTQAYQTFNLQNLSFAALDLNRDSSLAKAGEYDAIYGNGILHHLHDDLEGALKRILKALKPGGKIAFFEPNLYNPYVYLIFTVPILRHWAKLEPQEMALAKGNLAALLAECGYRDISVEFNDFLLPNTPDVLIEPICRLGSFLERNPVTSWLAQSLYIRAAKPGSI